MTEAERSRYLEEMLNKPVDDERSNNASHDIAAQQMPVDEEAQILVEDQATAAVIRGDVESSDRVIVREQVLSNPETGERVVEKQTTIVPSFDRVQEARISRAKRIVYYIARFITIFLLIQFVLRLIGANPDNAFANFIYAISSPFYFPFRDLFGRGGEFLGGEAFFDSEALFAIAIYWLFTYLAVKGIGVFIRRSAIREANRATMR